MQRLLRAVVGEVQESDGQPEPIAKWPVSKSGRRADYVGGAAQAATKLNTTMGEGKRPSVQSRTATVTRSQAFRAVILLLGVSWITANAAGSLVRLVAPIGAWGLSTTVDSSDGCAVRNAGEQSL